MGNYTGYASGMGDLRGCKSLDLLSTSPTDLGLFRATAWIATWCANVTKPLAISAMASQQAFVAIGQWDKKTCQDVVVRVSRLVVAPGERGLRSW